MPNQPSPDKVVLSFMVPRPLKRRIQILAKGRGESMSETIIAILTNATINIELSPEDYILIAKAIQSAQGGNQHPTPSRSSGESPEVSQG